MPPSKPTPTVSVNFIDKLITAICHDVGASVRHAIQFSELLTDCETKASLDEKDLRWLRLVNGSGQKTQTMLNSLKKLSRISVRSNDSSEVDLGYLLDTTLKFQLELNLNQGDKIEIHTHGEWPKIVACKEHWVILFSNLIENALIFHPNTKGHVKKLDISCELVGTDLKIIVQTNGIATSESQRKMIPNAYKRLNNPEEFPGIGMGLTYCEYIAEINNGSLGFEESYLGGLKVTYHNPNIQLATTNLMYTCEEG